LFILPFLSRGGAEKQFKYIVNCVSEEGNLVDLLLLNRENKNITKKLTVNKIMYIKNAVWNNNSNYIVRNFVRLFGYLFFIFKFLFAIHKYNFIITHNKLLMPLIPIFKLKADKLIFSIREADKDYTRYFYLKLLKISDILTCNSEITYSMLKNKLNNVYFIKNGIDIENSKLSNIKPPMKLNAIGIIANIDKRKNIEVIIDSLKYLPKDIKFYIAGNINDKKYQTSLIKKAKRNMNLSQIIFLGYISNIEKFYEEVDLIILPSLYEGTSNVILESFKYGKLILVSNIKENICLINKKYHEYFIFDCSDPKDLAYKIVKIRKMAMQKNIILKDFLENNFIFLENNYSLKKLKEEYSKLINN